MSSWSIILLVAAICIYIGGIVGYRFVRFVCRKTARVNIRISLAQLAILLAISLFSLACIFSIFNDAENALDFSAMAFYLLAGGVLMTYGSYIRSAH